MKTIALLSAILIATGCSQQQRALMFGGTNTIDIPVNEKVVSASCGQDQDLWYLTRPMTTNDTTEKLTFRRVNAFGTVTTTIMLQEWKSK